jgi:hypothetical protein
MESFETVSQVRWCSKLYRYAFPFKYLNCLMRLEAAARYTVSIQGNPPICHVSAFKLLSCTSSLQKRREKSFMDVKEHWSFSYPRNGTVSAVICESLQCSFSKVNLKLFFLQCTKGYAT